MINIDIWGCCVTRDIFGIMDENKEFNINAYVWSLSFSSLYSKKIFQKTFSPEDFPAKANFISKMCCLDLNKNCLELYEKSGSDWLVLDLRPVYYCHYMLEYETQKTYISEMMAPDIMRGFTKKGLPVKLSKPIAPEDYQEFLKFIDFCNKRYGDKIILIEALDTFEILDKNGTIQPVEGKSSEEIAGICELEYKYNIEFYKRTHCYIIRYPHYNLSDEFHKWGFSRVHYIKEYYSYAFNCVKAIVNGEPDIPRKLSEYHLEVMEKMLLIKFSQYLSYQNTKKRLDTLFNSNEFTNEYLELCNVSISQGFDFGYAARARLYRYGRGVSKDLYVAAEWYRKANSEGKWPNELFDTLWEINTEDSRNEMIAVAKKAAENGDTNAMGRLGRAYC